jgi:hypothetical protein
VAQAGSGPPEESGAGDDELFISPWLRDLVPGDVPGDRATAGAPSSAPEPIERPGPRPLSFDLLDQLDESLRAHGGRPKAPRGGARFRYSIRVGAVPQGWFEEFLAALHDEVEALPFHDGRPAGGVPGEEGIRLVEGRHLDRGARYRLESHGTPYAELVVRSWDRYAETRLDVLGGTETGDAAYRVKLRSAAEPRVAGFAGRPAAQGAVGAAAGGPVTARRRPPRPAVSGRRGTRARAAR